MSFSRREHGGSHTRGEAIGGADGDGQPRGSIAPGERKRKSWSPSDPPGVNHLPPISSFLSDAVPFQRSGSLGGMASGSSSAPWLDTWAASIHHNTRTSLSPDSRTPSLALPSAVAHPFPSSSSSSTSHPASQRPPPRCTHSVDSKHAHRREPLFEPPNGGALYPLPSGLVGGGSPIEPPSRGYQPHAHQHKHHSTYLRESGIVTDDDTTPTRERPYFVSPDSHYHPTSISSLHANSIAPYPAPPAPIQTDSDSLLSASPASISTSSTSYHRPRKFSSSSMEEYRTIPAWTRADVDESRARLKPVPHFMSSHNSSSSDSLPLPSHRSPNPQGLAPRFSLASSSSSSLSSFSGTSSGVSTASSRLDADSEHARTPDVASLQIGTSYFPSSTSDDARQVRHESVTGSDSSDSSAPTSSENGGWTTVMPLVLPAVSWGENGDALSQGTLKYACSHCPKRFARPSSLRIHLNSHTGDKPFDCDVCGRSFSVQSNLRRHLKIHRKQGLKTFLTASSESSAVEEKSPSEEGGGSASDVEVGGSEEAGIE